MIDDDELGKLVKDFLNRQVSCSPCCVDIPKAASLEGAIEIAARSRDVREKKHSHQRRIPDSVLDELRRSLLQDISSVNGAKRFEDLHPWISGHCATVKGAGELLAYDVAFRLGLYLGFEPNLVYLHAGTRVGARKLGVRGKAVPLSELPAPLQALRPWQVEDFLCLYRDRLD